MRKKRVDEFFFFFEKRLRRNNNNNNKKEKLWVKEKNRRWRGGERKSKVKVKG